MTEGETLRLMIQGGYESLHISPGVWGMSFNWHSEVGQNVVDDMSSGCTSRNPLVFNVICWSFHSL